MKLLDGLYAVENIKYVMVARDNCLVGGRGLPDIQHIFRKSITSMWEDDYTEEYGPKHLLLPAEFLD